MISRENQLGDGLMDWDRVEAWLYTILGLFFILGFVLESFPIVLTVMVLALLLLL
ncbi:uncharacterized protein METZ01_LOCUS491714, partial [marine metagenome]